MNNKLSLAGIVLAAVLGCDSNTDHIEQRPDRRVLQETESADVIAKGAEEDLQEHYCSQLPSFPTAPFTLSYSQRGINIDPDNNGNVGLLPEPFKIRVNLQCDDKCNENTRYIIGMQTFNERDFQNGLVFSPRSLFQQNYFESASSFLPGELQIQSFAQGYQFLITRFTPQPLENPPFLSLAQELFGNPNGIELIRNGVNGPWFFRDDLLCQIESGNQTCDYEVERISGQGFSYPPETLENQTLVIAYAPIRGSCDGIDSDKILLHYLVFGNQFIYE